MENKIQLNFPQLLTIIATQKHKRLEWGRGTGKSTILAWFIKEMCYQMPRATFTLVGETYGQILTRTLPSTISALEMLGYHKDHHYWIGRRPPASWKIDEPFEPPLNYDHFFIWHNGAGFHLVSQDRPGSGRGLNIDGCIGDEMQLLDIDRLFADVLATNRGHLNRYKSALHHSTLFAGTIPLTQKGKWIYNEEKQALENPNEILYLRASAEENRHNLGDEFFTLNRRMLTDLMYNAEILNIRPGKIDGGFYPHLNEQIHYYNSFDYSYLDGLDYNFIELKAENCKRDNDVKRDEPIDIALDYGAAINWIVSGQEVENKFRFQKACFVKQPGLTSDVVRMFCDYYLYHNCKHVNYYYDQTAIGKSGLISASYKDDVIKTFNDSGWTVTEHYLGPVPSYQARYRLWGMGLTGDQRIPSPFFNKQNCIALLVSMQNAPIREGKNGFEKDKRSEGKLKDNREEATDGSDAADTLYFGKYHSRIVSESGFIDNVIG